MIERDEALGMLAETGQDRGQINHALQTEAVLRALAERFGQDPELWGLTGLLHDLDYAETKDEPQRHGLAAAEALLDRLPETSLRAIRAHNSEMNGCTPESTLDYALRCGESVTGLISANALVRPEGMRGMKPKSLKKKMKDKSFAAGVSRDRIAECERLGLELNDFFQTAIAALSDVAEETGLESG
jgi:hypothetical protein